MECQSSDKIHLFVVNSLRLNFFLSIIYAQARVIPAWLTSHFQSASRISIEQIYILKAVTKVLNCVFCTVVKQKCTATPFQMS